MLCGTSQTVFHSKHVFFGGKVACKYWLFSIMSALSSHSSVAGGGGCVGVIRGMHHYGMPVHKHPEIKGNLYVEFELDFPETLSCETAEVSRTLTSRDHCVCVYKRISCLSDCLSNCLSVLCRDHRSWKPSCQAPALPHPVSRRRQRR